MVGRRSAWAKVCLRKCMNRVEMRILAVVGLQQSENLCHRKGKGSLTMQISQGLVDPNLFPNRFIEKGKEVNIPLLILYVRQRKLYF